MIQENKKERLNKAYGYLYDHGVIHSVTELAEIMGRARPGVSNALSGSEDYLNDKFLAAFARKFADYFNFDWIMNGEGEMLTEKERARTAVAGVVPDYVQRLIDEAVRITEDNRTLREQLAAAIRDNASLKANNNKLSNKLDEAISSFGALRNQVSVLVTLIQSERPSSPLPLSPMVNDPSENPFSEDNNPKK